MSSPAPQRAWRAACPNCGAPVEFRSAASASAVCSYCRSTLVRDGESLRRIGQSAELFDDFSPLQLGAGGVLDGIAFTLVGRLQQGSEAGPWNEWHALFDNGRSGWLSEDNGRYVFAFDAPPPADAPAAAALPALRPGAALLIDGRRFSVASVVAARLLAAEGELPAPPVADRPYTVVDVRDAQGQVGTLDDAGGEALHWSLGRSVALSELRMQNLREAQEKTLKAEGLPCPNCGAGLPVTLANSLTVVCASCKSVVDLSKGPGEGLAHYAQVHPHDPPIPIGQTGRLRMPWAAAGSAPLDWQVVGYQERIELAEAGETGEAWREYLLYNRLEGFAFLVDTNQGFSLSRVLTGVPVVQGGNARSEGVAYSLRFSYGSVASCVLGEFYWRVEAGQVTRHRDFAASSGGRRLTLSEESTPGETTWSAGEDIPAAAVAAAFGLPPPAAAALSAGPPDVGAAIGRWWVLLLILIAVVVLLSLCSRDACYDEKRAFGANSAEYRACRMRSAAGTGAYTGAGGSWGGFSSGGGGHK